MLELMNCFLTRGLTLFLSGFVRGALVEKNLKKYIYLCHYFYFFYFCYTYMCILGVICKFTTGCT